MTIVMKIFALLVYKLTFFKNSNPKHNKGAVCKHGNDCESIVPSKQQSSFVPFSSLNPFGNNHFSTIRAHFWTPQTLYFYINSLHSCAFTP